KPVTDPAALSRLAPEARAAVRTADLSSISGLEFRAMPVFGFGARRRPAPVVLEGEEALSLAQYPNEGFLRVAEGAGHVRGLMTDQGFQQRGVAAKPAHGFFSGDSSLARFAGAKDLMVRGYWKYYWADLTSRVKSIDPVAGAVVLSVAEAGDEPRVKAADRAEPGNPFWFVNALEALDRPGEWYIDNAEKRLYVWPRAAGAVSVSVTTRDMVAAEALHDVAFEGVSFDGGGAMAAVFSSCTNVAVRGCSFRGFGISAVEIKRSRRVVVEDCAFADFGRTALFVDGGERKTLEAGGLAVRRCTFARNSMYGRVHPAILVGGVGVEVSRCTMHDMPSSALRLEGNDHLVVSNHVSRVCYECDDNAAVDIYRNPSYAGCRFLYNLFEDCGRAGGFADCGQCAIRFDGNISGMTVRGNTFRRCGTCYFGAININGGRLNVVDSNVFEDCAKGVTVFFYPDWHWRRIFWGDNHHAVFIRKECFEDLRIREGVYAARYPGMARLPETPQVNFITRNRAIGGVVADRLPAATVVYGN
ncbi:MAG: right-handed parallel beta-helix repeat-containing protein, partial [Kiritimatiellae bacterium]|nr:right-handed parallel beta-helix repeat-containing protein [Kiritimatiellia bacterium]